MVKRFKYGYIHENDKTSGEAIIFAKNIKEAEKIAHQDYPYYESKYLLEDREYVERIQKPHHKIILSTVRTGKF